MLQQENVEKMERYIEDFYKDFSRVRMDKWNYEDGCIMIAAIQLYEAAGDVRFRNFVVEYMDRYVTEEGEILHYKRDDYKLDDINPGRAVLFVYEQTGEKRIRKAMEALLRHLEEQPRTEAGNFWHKKIYPNQVWLDGLFMAQPFYMAWATKFGRKDRYQDICGQFEVEREKMLDREKGLYYHGYDASHSIFWADKKTGCSANFWLRAIGWFLVALVDTMEEMDQGMCEYFAKLSGIYKEAVSGMLRYRDRKSGLFYQVADHGEVPGNYLETSGSAMVAASILKACRLKVLSEEYVSVGEEILDAVIAQKLVDGHLKDCCSVAGLGPKEGRRDGSIAYYLSEPVAADDGKGAAAAFMAYAQYLKLQQ